MRKHLLKLLVLQAALCCSFALADDASLLLSAKGSGSITGTAPVGKESSWKVIIKSGKEARFYFVKGKGEIVVDVTDPHGIAADEGVSVGDWFPVEKGEYKASITNITNLEKKKTGHDASYEVKFEVR